MQIVPVIDLKGELVVHARQGERGRYEPIVTPLSRSAEPAAVLDGLLAVAPFAAVYVADLDAIMARRPINPAIERLAGRHAALPFWVDAGIASPDAAAALLVHDWLHPVIGSRVAKRLPAARAIAGSIHACCCRSTSAATISSAPATCSTGRSFGRAG